MIFMGMPDDPDLIRTVIECLVALERSWIEYLAQRVSSRRVMTEDGLDDVRIRDGMERIDDLRREIERQRRRLADIKQRDKRRKELERLRRERERVQKRRKEHS